MEKIDFVNATHPAINDTNLNKMQDNIETAINAQVSGDTLPLGAMIPFPGGTIPDNYLLCDGSAVSRTTYALLFNVIGTTYGEGDGSTTFNLPDMRSRTLIGVDTRDINLNAIGKTYGEKSHTMTINELVSHTHSVSSNSLGASGTTKVAQGNYATVGNPVGNMVIGNTGGGQPFNVMQPSMVTNYIIKAFQTAGVVAEVVNEHSTSTTNVYSADYINNLNTYSTTEARIGYWIDGKPLYRKVVSFGVLPNANTKRVEHGIFNLKDVISVSGIAKRYIPASQTYSWQPLPLLYAGNSTDFNASLSINPTHISIACDNDRTDFTENYIFIEYTKTTD